MEARIFMAGTGGGTAGLGFAAARCSTMSSAVTRRSVGTGGGSFKARSHNQVMAVRPEVEA